MEQKQDIILKYLSREVKLIFFILTILGAIAHIGDIIIFKTERPGIIVQNSVVAILLIVAIVFYYCRALINLLLGSAIYLLLLSIFGGYYLSGFRFPDFAQTFLRNTIYASFLLSLATLFIHKRHAYFIAILFTLFFAPVMWRSFQMQSNTSNLIVYTVFIAFAITMHVISERLVNSLTSLELDRDIIRDQKDRLAQLLQQNIVEAKNAVYRNKIISRKNAQLLLQGEKLREVNETKDKFMSIIAHDLKNPMTTIAGFSEILSTRINSMSEAKREMYATSIYHASGSLLVLLDNLLLWSRNQSGKLKLSRERFHLCDILQDEIRHITPTAQKKEIHLIFESEGDCIVLADKNMLATVVRNLLSNAIKFSFRRSEVILKVEQSELSWKVSVMDQGLGMEDKLRDTIFDMRSENRKEGTEGEPSTGLGLTLCNEFIILHNGVLDVESKPGQGSVFWFEIPVLQNE